METSDNGVSINTGGGLKSRKLIVSMIVFFTGTLMLWLGKIDASNWVGLSQVILGAYALGNVGEHYTKRMSPSVPIRD